MSVYDVIKTTSILVRVVYKLAVAIRDSKTLKNELKEIGKHMTTDLTIVGGLLDNLQNYAQRVSAQDEKFLLNNIELLQSITSDAQTILEKVQRDRNFFQRLFMKNDEYRQQLREISKHLHESCIIIQGALPTITRIEIPRREFPDFRGKFHNVPQIALSFYNFSIIKNTSNSMLTIIFEEFDTTKRSCYMKLCNEQFVVSYQLRTWSALNPRPIVIAQRVRDFQRERLNRPNSPATQPPSLPSVAANNTRETLDFAEFYMSHDDICGIALTPSIIYIATKCEVTSVSLSEQRIIAQYCTKDDGLNRFNDISYIYIPPNDERNLYIVDRGQYAVLHYKIDNSGHHFEYIRRYVVIAKVSQECNLISCAIFNKNLYVSDDANNCLHIFPLNGERQSSYLCDNSMTPFSPGPLCAHGKYLYVANCSTESPGILVFNEECQPIDWYRNQSLQEILAIDIDPNIHELYVLTTTANSATDNQRKRPLIVSINLAIRNRT